MSTIIEIAHEKPTARFEHRCSACGLNIQSGEQHERFVVRDGDTLNRKKALRSFRVHLKCPPMVGGDQ